MRNGIGSARRFFHTTRVLQGFRRLIKPPIFIDKLVTAKDASPKFVSTQWQHDSEQNVSKWIRRADDSILRLQSLTARDVHLLNDAEAQPPSVYVALLGECGQARALSLGKQVHQHLARAGLHQDSYLANHLLIMYGKCGSMEDAREVLDKMPFPNVVSWNIMINAYARNGYIDQSKSVFDSMSERTLVSWNSMLLGLTQDGKVDRAREFFERMPWWNDVSWTTVMTAYAQQGDLLESMSFFNRMPRRDVVAWTTMIRGHALRGLYRQALCLFRKMNLEGLRPDKVTLLTILESCDSRLEGVSIHSCIRELGYEEDVVVGTALINMYGRCGCLETARKIFIRIQDKDVVAWTSIVNAYSDNGYLEVARHILERMPLKNSASWNVVITAYARGGYLREARVMFNDLADKDVVTWTTMITSYAQKGHSKKSLDLFRLMIVDGVPMDRITLVSVLHVCGAETALKVGEAIYQYIVDVNMQVDTNLGTALMTMFGKCGDLGEARRQFDFYQQKDIGFWNAMIQLYGHNGHGKQALRLHTDMVHQGMQWNDITCLNVLSACSHSGLLHDGRAYFLGMEEDYGVQQSLEHYICMMDLLARAGRVYDARDLIDNMPFEPNAAAWAAFLTACKAQGKTGGSTVSSERNEDVSLVSEAAAVMASSTGD